ncbi:MAG: hypothetical protein HY781_05975 [Chloroflexi bacterium]|nr:hypothetical protein [Chloroflexota bacterium]
MELLRDTIWQFVGVLVAILAVIITIAIFFFQRKKKELTWIVLSQSPLLSVESKSIKVFYKKINVDSIYIIEIKIVNTGNAPILPTDYVERLGIDFNEKNKILSAEITKVEPDTINAIIDIEGDRALMRPLLLNPKDSINFRLLTQSACDDYRIIGRIIGINKIKKQVVENYIYSRIYNMAFWSSIGVLLFGVTSILLHLFNPDISSKALTFTAIFTGIVLVSLAKLYANFWARR